MPELASPKTRERRIEDQVLANLRALGFDNALAIRQVRFGPNQFGAEGHMGKVDVLVLPSDSSKLKLVIIEAKATSNKEWTDKVLGQLLKYYSHALKLGTESLSILRSFATNRPEDAKSIRLKTPVRLCQDRAKTEEEAIAFLRRGDRILPNEIALIVACDAKDETEARVLLDIQECLRKFHNFEFRLVAANDAGIRYLGEHAPN